jgi:hypothetical protein
MQGVYRTALLATTLLVATIFFSFDVFAAPGWHEYRSTNFIMLSDVDEQDAINHIKDLEVFRAGALKFSGFSNTPDSQTPTVFLFNNRREFELYVKNNSTVEGFFQHTLEGPIMVLPHYKQANDKDKYYAVFHEYVHSLVRDRSIITYPKWYSEGLADLLGATVIKDNHAIVGRSNIWRHWQTTGSERLSVAQLIDASKYKDNDQFVSQFYATSWLLTHYLLLGSFAGEPDYSGKLWGYLKHRDLEAASVQDFEKALGVTVEALDAALKRYANSKTITGVSFPVSQYSEEVAVREFSKAESLFRRADLFDVKGIETKSKYLYKKIKPGDIYYARALSRLAILNGHASDFKNGKTLLDKALKMAPADYDVLVDAAHFYGDYVIELKPEKPWTQEQNQLFSIGMDYATQAYQHPNKTQAIMKFKGILHEINGDTIGAIKLYMERYAISPNDIGLNVAIATYLADTPKPGLAIPFLEKYLAYAHNQDQLEWGQEKLAEIRSKISKSAQQP